MKRNDGIRKVDQNEKRRRLHTAMHLLGTASFLLYMLFFAGNSAQAQTYPFDLPAAVTAELNVVTEFTEVFNNKNLGVNIGGFSTTDEKDLIRAFDPVSGRFPLGLWSNWYDWRTDQLRVFGDESWPIGHLESLKTFERMGTKLGIGGYATLNNEKKAANNGQGYDIVWTYNMSADGTDWSDNTETIARYQDRIARGFEVKHIEMGNENFYGGQRSSIIPTHEEYILRAKSMSKALKEQDPDIKVSVPLLRRGSFFDPRWNEYLTEDLSYFDAMTIHMYIGHNPDDPATSDYAYSTALTARNELKNAVDDYARVHAPDKPVWLTEWGVRSGSANSASILGMADCYLYMSENQNIYHRANWFIVNGVANSFLVMNGRDIQYPLEKTSYGATHEILRSVFENSIMLGNTVNTTQLEAGVNAVNAKAVVKDGQTMVFAINMTDQAVPFTLKFNDEAYTGNFVHEALKYDSLAHEKTFPLGDNPLLLEKEGSGAITLPPLSVNVISGLDVVPFSAYLILPDRDDLKPGADLQVEAGLNVDVENISSISLYMNDVLVSERVNAPFVWGTDPDLDEALKGLTPGSHDFKLVATDTNSQESTSSASILVPEYAYFASPKDGALILKSDIAVKAGLNADVGAISSLELLMDGVSVRTLTEAPFEWGMHPELDLALRDLSEGAHELTLITTTLDNEPFSTSIGFTVQAPFGRPYAGDPVSLPGTIEAEDYNTGGQGMAYNDTDIENKGGAYRTDGVDVGPGNGGFIVGYTMSGEWLNYTINMAEPDTFDIAVVYSSGRPGGGAKIGGELINLEQPLFSEFLLPNTGGWAVYDTLTVPNIVLPAGEHVFRLNIAAYGSNIDKLVFTPSEDGSYTSIHDAYNTPGVVLFPNPSADGIFNLSEHVEWETYSMSGTKVLTGRGQQINLSAYPQGVYIVKINHVFTKVLFR